MMSAIFLPDAALLHPCSAPGARALATCAGAVLRPRTAGLAASFLRALAQRSRCAALAPRGP